MVSRQFYIYKFDSRYLDKNNYSVNLSFKAAKENDQIIAVSDSQMLRSIRDIQGRLVDKHKVELLFQKRDDIKKQPSSKTNFALIREINKQINSIMFVPEYVSIVISNKSHYKKLFERGLMLNDKKYVRFSCSASQARVNTVIFVQESVSKELYTRLNNGRHDKKLNPSKFNAYLGLSSSATLPVSTPRVCVVPDCILKRPTKVYYVTEIDEPLEDDIIEEKTVDVEYNYFDGMGLISPEQAQKWADELELDYMPAEWCIRNAWIKGMVCVFDFKEFCELVNNGNYIINTIYKNSDGTQQTADLREIDVIISESQFKMWDCYDNYEEYAKNCIKNNLSWGVSRYTPKKDGNCLWLNYQSIQTLKLSDDDIIALCNETVKWIKGVSKDDIYKTILFLMGRRISKTGVQNFLKSSDNYWLKCLLLNHNLINDKYISSKIYDMMVNRIKAACMGKIAVQGNYQVLVSDPYAFAQHACGMEPTGLLGENEYYSAYWNDKDVKEVDCMRSPLTYRSEHDILPIVRNDRLDFWYKYLYTGLVFNVHSDDVLRLADSDFDFDLGATTDCAPLVNGVYRELLPITYQKKNTPKIDITPLDLFKADNLAFGSEIGAITNKSTSMYAMLPFYELQQIQYDEIEKRLIMTRVAQGSAIDKAKGVKTKKFPQHWANYQHINDDDSPEAKAKKEFFNTILIEKKPYFFRYLYKDSNTAYTKFLKEEKSYCAIHGIDRNVILSKPEQERTEQEKYYLLTYNSRNPLIDSTCEMNRLCHYLESVNFEVKAFSQGGKGDIYGDYIDYGILWDEKTYSSVLVAAKKFFKTLKEDIQMSDYGSSIKYVPEEESKLLNKYDKFKDKMTAVCSNIDELTNYLVKVFYVDCKSVSKDILWKCYGKTIFAHLFSKHDGAITIPVLDEDGKHQYLFDRYNIVEVASVDQ